GKLGCESLQRPILLIKPTGCGSTNVLNSARSPNQFLGLDLEDLFFGPECVIDFFPHSRGYLPEAPAEYDDVRSVNQSETEAHHVSNLFRVCTVPRRIHNG